MRRHYFYIALFLLGGILFTGCAHTAKESVNIPPEVIQTEPTDHRSEGDGTAPVAETIEREISGTSSETAGQTDENEFNFEDEFNENEEETVTIADPLEPWNRGVFVFNDRFYFWVMKPVVKVYSYVIPEDFRVIFKNFYQNITTPIRLVNNLLQLKIRAAGIELLRFLINTTAGVFGLADVAKTDFDLQVQDEDFGQTLGRYGIGHGVYIVWPFLGPSSIRDTVGLGGDFILHPFWYAAPEGMSLETSATLTAHEYTNDISFRIGDYEALKAAAIDPYIAIRNAYIQHRKAKVEK